jgi:hypothetical protein
MREVLKLAASSEGTELRLSLEFAIVQAKKILCGALVAAAVFCPLLTDGVLRSRGGARVLARTVGRRMGQVLKSLKSWIQ